MRRLSIVTLTLGAVLVGACSSRDSTSPRGITPDQSLATASTSSCSFSTMKSDAKNYFASTTDTVYNYISNMQQTFNKLGAAAATPIGWNIQRIVAAQRLTSSATGPSTAGAAFVADVFNCMDPTVISLPLDTAFTNHLAAALSGGIFEVRGDANALPAWAWISSGGSRVVPTPIWGVQPLSSWPNSPGGPPYLVFAYPKNISSSFPAAALIDGTASGFELGTVPTIGSKSGLIVGVCIATATTDKTTANRLLHNGAILLNISPTTLCTSTPTFVAAAPSSMSIMQRLASLFTTTSLFAQSSDFTGGTPDGWSPFGAGGLLGSNIGLSFTQVSNSTVNVQAPYTVHAAISGVAIPGLTVTVTIAGNSGVPAGAFIVPGSDTVQTTNSTGDATFMIAFGKAGGYTLTATGSLSGVLTPSAVSPVFNIKNQ